jgi:large subunit ribosomal protein L30
MSSPVGAAKLKVTQVRSTIGSKRNARESLRSLGLKRIHHTVVVDDNAVNRGYLKTAPHLVAVEDVSAPSATSASRSDDQ